MIKLRNRLTMLKQDQRGLTLMELVLAISLSSLVMALALIIFTSSVRTQSDVQNSVGGTAEVLLAQSKFSKNVRTASAFRIVSTNRVDLRSEAGSCESWVVSGGKLLRKSSTTAIPTTVDSTWKTVVTHARPIGTSPYFVASGGTGIQYSFIAGEGISTIDMVGKVTPRAPGATTSPCW